LYQILSGNKLPPFKGKNNWETRKKILEEEHGSLQIPENLKTLLDQLLDKNKEARPSTTQLL